LHHASHSGNLQMLERIWNLAKEQLTPEDLNKLLLAQDYQRRTAWHVASKRCDVEILVKFRKWAEKVLNTDELNNNLLLAEGKLEETVLHHAS